MIETENPAIKLFGMRIRVPASPAGAFPSPPAADYAEKEAEAEYDEETEQDSFDEQSVPSNRDYEEEEEELSSGEVSPDSVNPKTPSIDEETSRSKASAEDPKSQEKPPLKKPDKILPCPRCNSLETKFCYYNNYNVNQPRHFCKSCQRYWTAGGTMRNVPVGAGRRKSKSSVSRYHHISISEALQAAARADSPTGTHHQYPNMAPNGTVLTFGLNQYDSVSSPVENRAGILNGMARVSCTKVEKRDDRRNEYPLPNLNGMVPQVPWPYSVPIPFYPPAFWACGNVGIPTPWNFPMLSPPSLISAPNSPILGKHPREENTAKAETPTKNGSVLIPKTLRIDDPNEAAKSSIWATLGIKNERRSKGGFFTGIQSKGKENEKVPIETETTWVLCANPAALSRSLNFHEST